GCHLSFSNGYYAMGLDALKIGANVFQYFSRNPRGGKAKQINLEDIEKLKTLMKEQNFGKILVHAPYTLNPCSNTTRNRTFAREIMADDLERLEYIPHQYYNFHPGSHVGQGAEIGIQLIADMLNAVLKEEQTTTVLLETMAGKGSEIGRSFEELAQIIEKVDLQEKLGICLDTCHISDAGYDIINNFDNVLEEFDKILNLSRLKAIHLNDSLNEMGSKKDRHALIGQGKLGLSTIINVINHPKCKHLPFYLETPNDTLEGYKNEIELLKQKRN
ncbi:MAG TPA: deoxyribonuclease IV, partial [Planctomycetota bacterium]|nr:deoxyribonuclease IV [Planctomycetota bacterium]